MSPAFPAVPAGTAATGTDAGSGLSPGAGRPRVLAALVVLGVLWGGSFPLIAVATPTLGPVAVTHARVVVALVVLAAVAGIHRRSWPALARRPGPFLLLAALNVALPLTLVATAVVGLNASLAAVLNATTPMFAVLVAAVWLGQPVTARTLVGVALGVLGVSVLVGGAPVALDPRTLLAVAASLTAAALYAVGGAYAASAFAGTPPLPLALGQQLAAALLLLPATAAVPPPGPPTPGAAAAVMVLGVGATAGGYLLYFWIIRQAGPVTAATVTLLVPVVGAAGGVAWLGEPLTIGLLLGLPIILTGVVLLTGPRRRLPTPLVE